MNRNDIAYTLQNRRAERCMNDTELSGQNILTNETDQETKMGLCYASAENEIESFCCIDASVMGSYRCIYQWWVLACHSYGTRQYLYSLLVYVTT